MVVVVIRGDEQVREVVLLVVERKVRVLDRVGAEIGAAEVGVVGGDGNGGGVEGGNGCGRWRAGRLGHGRINRLRYGGVDPRDTQAVAELLVVTGTVLRFGGDLGSVVETVVDWKSHRSCFRWALGEKTRRLVN